jgi:hypothetical protein
MPPPTTLADLLLAEPQNGAHRITYVLVAAVYFAAYYCWRNPFRSAATAAIYATFHEGMFFLIYYGWQPSRFISGNPLAGDRAYALWMLCVLAIYWRKRYGGQQPLGLWCALAAAAITRLYQVGVFGLQEKPESIASATCLAVGWIFMAAFMLLYIWENRCEAQW